MNVKGEFNQENQLQCAIHLGLEANKNVIDDYLDFYIKDGKTYLKNMSTKSQSLASKIGIKENTKISAYNPFLDLTDKELCEMFTLKQPWRYLYLYPRSFTALPNFLIIWVP